MTGEEYARRSARVVLLDGAGRVLLCRAYRTPGTSDKTGWFTPGGGVADGEPPREAAARELWEETGLAVAAADLAGPVAVSTGYVEWESLAGWVRDDYYHCRVGSHRVDTSRLEPPERAAIIDHRWWTAGELADTTELVYPVGLAGLVTELIAGRIPPEPVRLPWEH